MQKQDANSCFSDCFSPSFFACCVLLGRCGSVSLGWAVWDREAILSSLFFSCCGTTLFRFFRFIGLQSIGADSGRCCAVSDTSGPSLESTFIQPRLVCVSRCELGCIKTVFTLEGCVTVLLNWTSTVSNIGDLFFFEIVGLE